MMAAHVQVDTPGSPTQRSSSQPAVEHHVAHCHVRVPPKKIVDVAHGLLAAPVAQGPQPEGSEAGPAWQNLLLQPPCGLGCLVHYNMSSLQVIK